MIQLTHHFNQWNFHSDWTFSSRHFIFRSTSSWLKRSFLYVYFWFIFSEWKSVQFGYQLQMVPALTEISTNVCFAHASMSNTAGAFGWRLQRLEYGHLHWRKYPSQKLFKLIWTGHLLSGNSQNNSLLIEHWKMNQMLLSCGSFTIGEKCDPPRGLPKKTLFFQVHYTICRIAMFIHTFLNPGNWILKTKSMKILNLQYIILIKDIYY